ncbi:MAG: dehydrogenase, partial [Pedobacter sp.]
MFRPISNKTKVVCRVILVMLIAGFTMQFKPTGNAVLQIKKDAHIVLIGNNLGSRMMNYGHFETELNLRYPESNLYIRNMCDGGNTPGFRPHASRVSPWAFPGAEKFQTEYANPSQSEGHFETPDQWLTRLKTDIIVAFFGYNESFQGPAKLDNYKAELDAFIKWTLSQKYNGTTAPQLAIVSPIAFEDLSAKMDLPNGRKENENLLLYTKAMKEVAEQNNVLFVDAFTPSRQWYADSAEPLTIDGSQLNEEGYKKLGVLLV